jgi:putative spermidine/putrescine transport system substrate-binding protein
MPYWDGRSYAFIDKGNPWAAFYIPEPGTIAGSVLVSKVKGAPPIAWDYVNCVLSHDGQLGHAETILYGITNKTVTYPDAIKDKVTAADRVVVPPYDKIFDLIPGWIERWNKEMQ